MQYTLGAGAKARSAEPGEPPSRGKEQCGAALRGHACDDISRIRSAYRSSRGKAELIKLPRDVAQSSLVRCPGNSANLRLCQGLSDTDMRPRVKPGLYYLGDFSG